MAILAGVDDARVGSLIRALRRRRGWRQKDLAEAGGLHQSDISEMERGHLGRYRVEVVRRVFAALEARCDVEPRWRGAALDRLLDEQHAALAGRASMLLGELGWEVLPEVTYSEYGERGSIDLFAGREALRAICVTEIKTEFVSAEATLRSIDIKARLAPKLCRERFGFEPLVVARFLVLPDKTTSRRRLAQHASLLNRFFPLRGWQARHWLSHPVRPGDRTTVGGILLLPEIAAGDAKVRGGGRQRVRVARGLPDIATANR